MTRTRTLVLTTSALLALGALAPVGGAGPLSLPAALAQEKVDPVAEWDKRWERSTVESANVYEQLYKWCIQNKLSFTAINVRRLVLRYDPDNDEVRKYVGYEKSPDGQWVRNENRRDAIRDEADIEDPKAKRYPEQIISRNKRVVGIWKGLATSAMENAKKDPAGAAAWTERAGRAWEKVLEVDPTIEEAHKALNHPKVNGRYVWPEAKPFILVRDERKSGGQKRAKLSFPTQAMDPDGLFKAAGLTGAAARTERFIVVTEHGKDSAIRQAQWCERALQDYVEVYGVPMDQLKDRVAITRFDHVKEEEGFRRMLQAVGWNAARIAEFMKYFGGTQLEAGERAHHGQDGAPADDHCIHWVARGCALGQRSIAITDGIGPPQQGTEDWLESSIAYDLTRRLTGTCLTVVGAFGKYGTDMTPRIDRDIWMEMARKLVEYDDDVPLSRLVKCKYEDQNIREPQVVKGYALIQFLFESDVEKAREFIRTALVTGTPTAVTKVFGEEMTMDELDKRYRNWILKSW